MYADRILAEDPEGGLLTYTITGIDKDENPIAVGLSDLWIDPQLGTIVWNTPETAHIGLNKLTVTITDDQGAAIQYTFPVVVSDGITTIPNKPPTIELTPVPIAEVDTPFKYTLHATDPDGDDVLFTRVDWPYFNAGAPENMPASAELQVIQTDSTKADVVWTPHQWHLENNGGIQYARVEFSDGTYTGSYRFPIEVRAQNKPPVIGDLPLQTVTAGRTLRFDIPVTNDDGDQLFFSIDEPAQKLGIEIGPSGRLVWPVPVDYFLTPENPDSITVQVNVSDRRTNGDDVGFLQINVVDDLEPPKVSLQFAPAPARVDQTVTFAVLAADNVGIASRSLTIDGQSVTLDDRGIATHVFTAPGTYTVVANATDLRGNSLPEPITRTIEVADLSGAPQLAITSPDKDGQGEGKNDDDGQIVTAPMNVIGSVSDTDLTSWSLDVYTLDGRRLDRLGEGTTTMPAGSKLNNLEGKLFDPTVLKNGPYILRLTASDPVHTNTLDRIVHVDGNLKLGNFTLSFTDMTVPVAGIPITVTRSYDTLRANEMGDFGYGWRMDVGEDMGLEVDYPPGTLQGFGAYPPFRDGTRVTVTREDGTTEGFTFTQWAEALDMLGLTIVWHPAFTPDPGVTSFLEVKDVQLTRIGDEYISWGAGGISYNPADAAFGGEYTLWGIDGFRRTIDANSGELEKISDRHGNELSFGAGGISSNRGRQLVFERDQVGRITKIFDPRKDPDTGEYLYSLTYEYSADGDLVAFYDRTATKQRETDPNTLPTHRFEYRTDKPHYIDAAYDALNRKSVTTVYNTDATTGETDSRLDGLVDVQGKTTSLAYDLKNPDVYDPANPSTLPTHTVTDQLLNPTMITVDLRENSVREERPNGTKTEMVKRVYGDANRPDQVTSETDQLGRTTDYEYGPEGWLTAVVLPEVDDPETGTRERPRTSYEYDAYGNVLLIRDAKGRETRFTYDELDRQTSRTLPPVAGDPAVRRETRTYGWLGSHRDRRADQ